MIVEIMMTKKLPRITFLIVLLTASLACSISAGGPDYPETSIPVSPEEVVSMQEQIEQAWIEGAESGIVSFQISETQLTSYISQKLLEQPAPPISEPQILLRDGQMQLYGKVTSGMVTANILIAMMVSVDETNGQPKIEIASADLGPIPAPEGLNNAISAMIGEAFTGSLGPVATGFRLEGITIADGIMTLSGRIK